MTPEMTDKANPPKLWEVEARARMDLATPGPWGVSAEHGHWQIGPHASNGWAAPTVEIDARSNANAPNDAAHVLFHCPANTALVIKCIERLRRRVSRGHESDCEKRWGGERCTCGADADIEALKALDASLNGGDRG